MRNMMTLFDNADNGRSPAGFRLHTLEVYNWGTFHDQIWRMGPEGHTALLTGANGSGKSTLVDALLTLLAPNRKRNYNQTARSGRRERSEFTYVRGAYGRLQSDEGYSAHVQYLRDKTSYTVLLAHFHNSGDGQDVTLAQVFWLNNGVNKFYVVAARPLSIADHFSDFDAIRALKKRLREMKNVSVHNQFNRYSRKFRKQVGLRSGKAMDLFNQTVTIKEIGRLNDFVRRHMLEKTGADEKIAQLQEQYENLMLAYQAMQKAEQQRDMLRPLAAQARKYEEAQAEIAILRGCQAAIPVYFAGRKWKLLKEAAAATRNDLEKAQSKLKRLDRQLVNLRQQDTDLQIAISKDETGRRLQRLEQEIDHVRQRQERKRDDAAQFNQLAALFDLPGCEDEAAFRKTRRRAKQQGRRIEEQLEAAAEQLRRAQIAENELQQQRDLIKQEVASLYGRSTQIPYHMLKLRARILDALTIAEADVPFVGELLKVKESERAWEGALERLLHHFALRLLVPERHYGRFVRYVNDHHLNGRVVFHRIPEDAAYRPHQLADPRALPHKLEIKPDSVYYEWIENELAARYNYICCTGEKEFERANRAITQSGLIKSGGQRQARYEKDDRRRIDDRTRYVLGWTNQDKIRALQAELDDLEQQLKTEKRQITQAKATQKDAYRHRQQLENLLTFADFDQLNWRDDAAQIQRLETQKERLEQSSDRLQQLQRELSDVKKQLAASARDRDQQADVVSKLAYQLEQYQKEIKQAKKDVRQADDEAMRQYAPRIKAQVDVSITLSNVDRLWRDVTNHFHEAIDSENRRSNSHMGRLLKMMQEYKDAYPGETADFDADVASIPEFDRELARIERDDLPQYTRRFKGLLNEKVIEAIALLQADLYKYVEEIEESIADLNGALRAIDYTPDTYIQLQTETTHDAEIREFKQALRDCLVDVGRERSEEAYEASFAKVRELITRFQEDQRWTGKVTDVRHWLNFAAVERYRADDAEKHYYSDSSGKSGGQKAKLAYTILASAIAFQFGLEQNRPEEKTFRFVVIDEAFSRSDENNARYAMQLFQELDLQLLVVTPMTGIHIVEPYISACHFVWNNGAGNNSQVLTMPIAQLHQERTAYQAQLAQKSERRKVTT